ncbi:unnamed protein product [Linum tenue]|uniref:Uncharacterized protein n=1 Tax=Linum tenue TaxID=586396 RepID=A0AAV0S7X8_9ROSI|nr:unnamed protein product [Linum tenue]
MLRRSLLTRNFPAAWRLLLLPSSRYVGSATSRPCSTVPSTAAVSTPRPYALEFGEHRPPSPSKRLKYRIDVLKKMLERKEGDLQPEPYDEEDCPDLKDYEYTDSETYWDGVPVLESEIEPPLKDSILEFGKYDKAEAELLPSIQKSLVELMLSGDHNDLVLVKHKQTSTNAIRMKKRWKVFYKYAYLLPDELTEKLERMTRELEDLVEREDLEEKVEFLRLLTDHWKKALMSYSNRLEAAGKEEEAAPQLDVVQPSPASAAPYTSNDAASYALEQLGIGYGYLGHDDWLWEFKELMEEYFKGRISRDVLPDLITESILKFRFEEVGKKEGRRLCRHGDVVYGEKEVVVLKRGKKKKKKNTRNET